MEIAKSFEMRCDIYERVQLADSDKEIDIIEGTELTPQIKMVMHEDIVQLVGHLLLKIKYVGGDTPWGDNEIQHSIPVEINIPAKRVKDAWLLDADIQNFSIEQMGPRSLNVTGVLKVYEKEQIKVESSKVKLPKEVAEAIETLRKDGLTDYWIIVRTADAEGYNSNNVNPVDIIKRWLTNTTGDWDAEEEKGTTHLLHALVNGYEAIKTPEDKVREMYLETIDEANDLDNHPQAEWWRSRRKAIEDTLIALNIKIEGINA